jgi:hypothetical protein
MPLRHTLTTTVLAAAGLAAGLQAADAPPWYQSTKLSGYADAYYKFNPDGRKSAAASQVDDVFDVHQNVFALAGGKLSLASLDGMGLVDLYFGDYAAALQPPTLPQTTAVGQAFISQPVGPLTVTLGRFFTHVGYEVVDSVANLNYSRGLLFGQVPFFHQGLKVNYTPMEGLGLMAMLDNGNSVNYPSANQTAGGAQLSYTGMAGLSLYLNYYYEPTVLAAGTPSEIWEKRHFLDLVFNYTLKDGLLAGGEYLYLTNMAAGDTDSAGNALGSSMVDPSTGKLVPFSAKTQGFALYVDYLTPMEGLSLTPRFEALYMPDAAPATPGDGGLTKFDYTLTARLVKGAVTNWLELRVDAADDAVYPAAVSAGPTAPGLYTEAALTWGAAYKF